MLCGANLALLGLSLALTGHVSLFAASETTTFSSEAVAVLGCELLQLHLSLGWCASLILGVGLGPAVLRLCLLSLLQVLVEGAVEVSGEVVVAFHVLGLLCPGYVLVETGGKTR